MNPDALSWIGPTAVFDPVRISAPRKTVIEPVNGLSAVSRWARTPSLTSEPLPLTGPLSSESAPAVGVWIVRVPVPTATDPTPLSAPSVWVVLFRSMPAAAVLLRFTIADVPSSRLSPWKVSFPALTLSDGVPLRVTFAPSTRVPAPALLSPAAVTGPVSVSVPSVVTARSVVVESGLATVYDCPPVCSSPPVPTVSVPPVSRLPPGAVVATFTELTAATGSVVAPLPTRALLVDPAEANGVYAETGITPTLAPP